MADFVVNARFLTQRITGVQRYAVEVSRRIKHARPATRFLAPKGVLHTELARELDAETVGRLRGHAWEQFELPRHLGGAGLISLCNASPLLVRRQIVTLHDAAPFSVPEAYSRNFTRWYRFTMRQLGRRARCILTDSRFSARELASRVGIAPERITVVPLGREHVDAVRPDPAILDRHDLRSRPFLLAVGSHSPHKNFAALVRAAQSIPDAPFLFVLAGGADPHIHTAKGDELREHVRHIGQVSDGELRALYENAQGYIHPAYYEGFGLPPLEAMTLGCPVISSQAGSLPEVTGDAACYFDPFDDADIARAIRRFMGDAAMRAELREKGLARARLFSWDGCTEQIMAIADRALA